MSIKPAVVVALGAYAFASLTQDSPGRVKLGQVLSIPLSISDPWTFTPQPAALVEGAALLVGALVYTLFNSVMRRDWDVLTEAQDDSLTP